MIAGLKEQFVEQVQRTTGSFVDYLIVLAKWKKVFAGVVLSCVGITVIAVLVMPPVYLAQARILTPDMDHATSLQLMTQSGGVPLPGGLLGKKSTTDLYVGLLQSRTVLDRVVGRFDLAAVYDVDSREEARQRILTRLHIENDRKSGIISIGVEDRDAQRAAEITNGFVDELKALTQEIAGSEASQRRLFYEEKLKEAKDSLVRSEEAMKGFQEKTGAIELKEQARSIIESVANVRAQIGAKEVHLKVLKNRVTSEHPEFQKTKDELEALQEQLVKMEAKSGNELDPWLSTGSMPAAGTGYVRKMRDLKYSETLFELLAKQYEMARLSETRSSALIHVVDKAIRPEKREKPKRAKAVAIALIAGLFAGTVASFLMQHHEHMMNDAVCRERMETLKRHFLVKS